MKKGESMGLIVERGYGRFSRQKTHNKWSLKSIAKGELIFDNVKFPKENILLEKTGTGAPLGCLDSARYGIAWGAIGGCDGCYDTRLTLTKRTNSQFGKSPKLPATHYNKKLARNDY